MLNLGDVLDRPNVRLDYDLSQAEVDELRLRRRILSAIVVPRLPSPISLRGPEDDFVLAAALAGDADVLTSGDKDVLIAAGDARLGRLRIVSVSAFLQEHAAS